MRRIIESLAMACLLAFGSFLFMVSLMSQNVEAALTGVLRLWIAPAMLESGPPLPLIRIIALTLVTMTRRILTSSMPIEMVHPGRLRRLIEPELLETILP